MESDQHYLAHFSCIGFPHWSTNGYSHRFGEMRRGAPRADDSQRAASRALNYYRSRS
jgi:hypothetical protein